MERRPIFGWPLRQKGTPYPILIKCSPDVFSVTHDLEERARLMKLKMHAYRQSGLTSSDNEATYRARSRDRDRVIGHRDRSYERSRDMERAHHHRSRRWREISPEVSDEAVHSDASETSDMSEISKISTISVKSTQSEKPHRKLR